VIRRRAGQGGSSLENPMFETMAAFVLQEHLAQQSFDPPVGPAGEPRLELVGHLTTLLYAAGAEGLPVIGHA
jgi:hypothetical protein